MRPRRSGAPSATPVLLCACLAAGLLFDPLGFLRMALLCSAVHEAGHILAYILCTHRLPKLTLRLGGAALSGTNLPPGQELLVLCAGPLANFVMAGVLYGMALYRARYGVYFLAAVSLCMGLYNLLPFGVLDGARIIQNLLPARFCVPLARAQRTLLAIFCLMAPLLTFLLPLPGAARVAAFLAPAYLLAQESGI